MKKHLAVLSIAVAGLCAVPFSLRAADPAPATPPSSDTTPAATGQKPGPGAGGRMDPAERLKKMTEELGLTQEQQDKIKGIFEKNGPQLKEIISKGRENLTEDDKTKLRGLMKSQNDEITAVLTDEQKEKMKAAMEKRRAERAKQQPQ